MYLLKQIYIEVNSVINQLIVTLVLTTSACLFSFSADAGTTTESPVLLRVEITASNGHVNTHNNNKHTQPSGKPITYYNTGRCVYIK